MREYLTLFVFILLPLWGLAAVAEHPSDGSGSAVYTVSVPVALDHLEVRACFGQGGTLSLVAGSSQAPRLLDRLVADTGVGVSLNAGKILVRDAGPDTCIDYRVDLASMPATGHWRSAFVRKTDAILASPGLFLWLPADHSVVELRFGLPKGFTVSAPWEPIDDEVPANRYRVRADSARVDGKVALGRFDSYRVMAEDAKIDVAVLSGKPVAEPRKIRQWVMANIDAVGAIYGRFPVPRLQLLVVPIGTGNEPVPWGQVSRSGGDAVHVYIDQRQSEAAFLDDWVLSHEFSHLFHPPLAGDSRWIYEGLASYYQYVSRARTGMMSMRDAWAGLHSGFERGRRGIRLGRTLHDATENMHVERAYMQVYWSGAAIFLLADLELRSKSDNQRSLDSVLAAFQDCCLPSDRLWQGEEFLRELDRLAGSDVFSRLAAKYRDSDRFPDLETAYRELGLKIGSTTGIGFNKQPQAAGLRNAIMGCR